MTIVCREFLSTVWMLQRISFAHLILGLVKLGTVHYLFIFFFWWGGGGGGGDG